MILFTQDVVYGQFSTCVINAPSNISCDSNDNILSFTPSPTNEGKAIVSIAWSGGGNGWIITSEINTSSISVKAGSSGTSATFNVIVEYDDTERDICSMNLSCTDCDNTYTLSDCPNDTTFTETTQPFSWDAPTLTTCCVDATITQISGPISGTILAPGIYTITYEVAACSSSEPDACGFDITVQSACDIDASVSTTDISCNAVQPCEGTATVDIVGGTAGFDIVWPDGQTGATATNLCEGCQDVIITDSNDATCSDTLQFCIDSESNYDADADGVADACDSCPGTTAGVAVDVDGCEIVNACTVIDDHDFESGWGIWNDGGYDCKRDYYPSYANSGDYCVRLRDNSGNHSAMRTDNLDLSGYQSVEICFSYITYSMDNSYEDFWLLASTNGGNSYTLVEEWNLYDEFVNNHRYDVCVDISGPTFSSSTRFKFMCDASGNGDQVYIDDVKITACGDGTPPPPTDCNNPVNLALNGTAHQSSTYANSPAYLAIDGNLDGSTYGGSITRTYSQHNAYWELDLGCVADVDYINIWNRSDAYSFMLDDYYVMVSEFPFSGTLNDILNDPNVWSIYQSHEAGRPTTITVGQTARYLCIVLDGCDHLSIAEVEVFGCCVNSKTADTGAEAPILGNILAGKVQEANELFDVTVTSGITNVYPNPAIDFVKVDFVATESEATQVSIYNIAGKKVYDTALTAQVGSNTVKIPVNALPSGTYLVQVSGNNIVASQKFLVR